MGKKMLFLSMYPAPYRVDLISRFSAEYDIDAFFETAQGDQRNSEWFREGSYYLLDTEIGRKKYREIDLSTYSIAVIYEYSTPEGVKLVSKCKKYKLPYIINCDGVMLERHGNFFKDLIKRYLVKGASGYFASGENAKNYFVKFGADERKIYLHTFSELEEKHILTKPVSIADKELLRDKLCLPKKNKIALAVGRFIPLKRYDKLISAWKNMTDDYVLLLIGGGPEKEAYQKIIEENGISNVIIKDFLPKNKLYEYYKAADIFVHPTSYDVWGLVINEAMAFGLPVVVSDYCVAGLELVKNGGNGYRIPMGDDSQMCRRVVDIIENPDLYKKMSENALAAIKPYTMSNMAQKQTDAIKEIIGE